jgi:nitroreductase/NAD-dependent dihydropyrimidine dehydrogenase PreA subunit
MVISIYVRSAIMLRFSVREDRCNRCRLCASDCPARIIEQEGDGLPFVSPENEGQCLECQHCLAICPPAAISVFGLNPADSLPVSPDIWPNFAQMTHLLRGRRSVRQYRNENVDRALIDRLLATVANAPTGVNNRKLTFTVIDDKLTLDQFRSRLMLTLVKAAGDSMIPPRLAYIEGAINAYAKHQADIIFRGAPHVLIISSPPESPCGAEDVPLALAYFELLAQSAGLGTVWCGMLKLALEAAPELKALIGLPSSHTYYAMLFGYPAVHYARTVQRDDAAKIRRVELTD